MKAIVVVNHMALQNKAVEFLLISLVYGADDSGMTVSDSNNRDSTASESQLRVWTRTSRL